jgi:hypothetical protein
MVFNLPMITFGEAVVLAAAASLALNICVLSFFLVRSLIRNRNA